MEQKSNATNSFPTWLKVIALVLTITTAIFAVTASILQVQNNSEVAVVNSEKALDKIESANVLYLKLASAVEKCNTDNKLSNTQQKGEIALIKKDVVSLQKQDVENIGMLNAQTNAMTAQMIATTRLTENVISMKKAIERLENNK